MRSTPILLDRLRHIRYDLQAVWDMDHLMDGGFTHILEKEVTFYACRTLLWFGLRSEDPQLTESDTGLILLNAGVGVDDAAGILNVFTIISRELFNSGVFEKPPEKQDNCIVSESTQMREPEPTMRGRVLDLVGMANQTGLLDAGIIWQMTPREIEEMALAVQKRRKAEEMKDNFRMGTVCKVIFESQGMTKHGGQRFEWTDFVPMKAEPNRRQTAEEMLSMVQQINAALGGEVK